MEFDKDEALLFFEDLMRYLPVDDVNLVKEFLSREKIPLALEVICDKIIDYGIVLPEIVGNKMLLLAAHLELDPHKTWETVITEDQYSHQIRRLYRDYPDLRPSVHAILVEVAPLLPKKDLEQIAEFLDHNELDLAVDALCACLIEEKIPVSKRIVDKIRSVLLDTVGDPQKWDGFVSENE